MKENTKKKLKLKVSAIKDGTVIDHIPAKNLFKVISILGLDKIENQITFGTNLESGKLGAKAIIKVTDKFFKDNEINKIALIAPHANLNIIKDYKVVEKRIVEIPDVIKGIVKCFNPKCITNNETITTCFKVVLKEPLSLKCRYCEKITSGEQIKMY
ncbi:MAG: aspartate carbamoyltransferase regulatory subunit [Prolixibacteraceae bacterium]|jgi:aspartate carbamoyltransferase regulatory subunit|nr:aspartate carbamoyltransferase regulatory subunit [Prolixibacteraceae bacterium]MBT6006882.1 aspartate carbamoyltransferase regulatory subunit [Prolixibacteraceae bacterium]MBT6765235.1 aspartate carbamoyltransferase regulatory subunit [Prolixibacteraceae bacterium]MBT7000987.1 aspartate carbamoyltransferase regulatory subunit [Prolixibacteraceae bacterium]MBT7395861.1 aspartate carbamoyltransferase regulatory subunit [Prolixibacteraceae bacterium]